MGRGLGRGLGLGLGVLTAATLISAAGWWWAGRAVAKPACETLRFEGSAFTACVYDPARHQLELVTTGTSGQPLRGFRALRVFLGKRASQVAYAMNAGMYDEEGLPIGHYVENGGEIRALNTRDGPGNFHLKPNGVFWIEADGKARVTETDAFVADGARPRWASQSGPMLVIDGALHPSIARDGPSLHTRNGVGACGGEGAVFVISEEPVSFGRLARLFRDQLHCRNALYFDGSVSSLWAPRQGRMDTGYSLGPMVVVYDRALAR